MAEWTGDRWDGRGAEVGVRVWAELVWLRGLWMVRGSPVSELTKVVDARGEGEVMVL